MIKDLRDDFTPSVLNNYFSTIDAPRLNSESLCCSRKRRAKPRRLPFVRFQQKPIDEISLCITSRCNLNCPDCCVSSGRCDIDFDMTLQGLEKLGKVIGSLRQLTVTGGEPTVHPLFHYLSDKWRSLFDAKVIQVATNGLRISDCIEDLLKFDQIRVTALNSRVWSGCPDNKIQVTRLTNVLRERNLLHKLSLFDDVKHYPRRKDGKGVSCGRAFNGIGTIWNGLLYPCCSAMGMDGAIGIPMTNTWRTDIMKVPLPCSNCVFG